MIIPDSGDGNVLRPRSFEIDYQKELIIPDSGDGNKSWNSPSLKSIGRN